MIALLQKIFVKNRGEAETRTAMGMLCGIVGIVLNVLLFAGKLIAGALSGSIAIVSDAFNNLSDAGSSVITLLGFRLASQKPDEAHPFGHGRVEYLSGLMVSVMILLMGFELLKSAVGKIIDPQPTKFGVLTFAILLASVAVKLYMALYNRSYGKRLGSEAMRATAIDSLSDCVATAVVIVSMLVSHLTSLQIDGWCGLLVAVMILWSGFSSAKATVAPLLGQPASRELVESISALVCAHEEVIGVHDLIVHDYGPGRMMVSLHAEVAAEADLEVMHDAIDNIEQELAHRLSCRAVIHMDPIRLGDAENEALKAAICAKLPQIGENVTLHDFRRVVGPTHTNLIFDVVVPFENKQSDAEVRATIERIVAELDGNYRAVVEIDRPFVGK